MARGGDKQPAGRVSRPSAAGGAKKRGGAVANGRGAAAARARAASPEPRARGGRRPAAAAAEVDGEIESASDDDEDERAGARRGGGAVDSASDSDVEDAETADERRVRMAKAMLSNLEAAKRARRDAGGGGDDDDDEIDRELQKQAAIAAGRHFERIAARLRATPPPPPAPVRRGHRRPPTALALARDERAAYTGSKDGELLAWDIETGRRTRLTPATGARPPIATLAASADGRLLACGGRASLLCVWDLRTGKQVEAFKGHRDGLTALSFAGARNELFTGSADRTVKVWNLDEMSYVETLFGHADAITALDALGPERALSAGADRSVRLWKVLEETQLVFHGHAAPIDCARMLSNQAFLTGSQDGSLCLWLATRKKAVATARLAHGRATPAATAATADGWRPDGGACNWISALAAVPFSDLAASGSADGTVRFWRCDAQESALEQVSQAAVPGFVNALEIAQTSRRFAVAAVGQEHRLGRWFTDKSAHNGIAIVQLPAGLASS